MWSMATLMKRAPAKVEPKMRSLGLDLNALDLIGKVPTKVTMPKNRIMKRTLRIDVIVSSSMKLKLNFTQKLGNFL